ncbi:hypothetical protein PY093_11075 [Cytobacillus sp. S13-E01]|uniref:hypothetical protein n=1 Tax=Cytobacillus sp. S13-E01 TaxID=3031326 RepID=UPI0023D7E121|nr:hypothetical protein [Cytobacillus sp. S13-E01]MDF0727240.1 hypothetical protein [Cytobacillus sp. S13-E01]
MTDLQKVLDNVAKAFTIMEKPENQILTDKDVYYKDDVAFPKNIDIPKEARYVKVASGVSEEFKNEIKKHYPYHDMMYMGFGFENYMGVTRYFKNDPEEEAEKWEKEMLAKYSDDDCEDEMPVF